MWFCKMRSFNASSVYSYPKLRKRTKRSLPGGRTARCFTLVLIAYPCFCRAAKKLGHCHGSCDGGVDVLTNQSPPSWFVFAFRLPLPIVLSFTWFGMFNDRQRMLPAKPVGRVPQQSVGSFVVVVPLAIYKRNSIQHKMIVQMSLVQMGCYDDFKAFSP